MRGRSGESRVAGRVVERVLARAGPGVEACVRGERDLDQWHASSCVSRFAAHEEGGYIQGACRRRWGRLAGEL